jgi:predicted nuclease of restriction endonuclease-like (RecB) superfamily
VARLLWGHLRVLLDRLKNRETREWHQRAAVEYGWSRNILVHQISSRLHERELPVPIQGEVPSVEDVQEVVEKLRAELADLGSKPVEDVQGTMSNEPCGKEARTPA